MVFDSVKSVLKTSSHDVAEVWPPIGVASSNRALSVIAAGALENGPDSTRTDVKAERASVSALRPNPWNPNRMDDFMFEKELESIRRFGFVVPVVIRITPRGSEIIDGEHRWRAAKELRIDSIPVWNLGEISDTVAKQLTIVLNETKGKADKQLLSKLVQDLLVTEPSLELGTLLPFPPEIFADLGKLQSFDWQELEKLSNTTDRTQWVERLYRMPKDVAEVLDQAVAKVKDNVKREIDDDLADWQALEVLAADYLAGV